MKRALPALLTLLVLLTVMSNTLPAYGQVFPTESDQNASSDQNISDEVEDDAPVPRVARLSFIQGDVSFLRAGVNDWAAGVENLPLLAGDQIYAGPGARAEVQLGRGNYIRLSEKTALTITELSDSQSQFEITEGVAIITIARLQTAFGRFEVDTPNSALVLQQDGLYRINVRGNEDSEVIVRRGAAEVSTVDGSFKVREGHKLLVDTSTTGRLEIALDDSRDDWDQWSFDRDLAIDRSGTSLAPDYVSTYETTYSDLYGVSDLSSYGAWTSDSSYGYCWRPRVDYSWAPYRDGQWLWVQGAGWTWLANEPWGWAPYHYGRWAFSPALGWVWVPGFGPRYPAYSRGYYRWRPALVSFFDCPTSRGHYVGWYPLAPGERWRNWNRRAADHSHLQYPIARGGARRPDDNIIGVRPPRNSRGVSLLPVDGFTRPDRSRTRPVTPDKDLRDWIGKGARPGLPDIKLTPVASAPSLREGGERRYRIAIPPGEIINRPVVTRNRPVESQVGVAPPRERRLIVPRNPVVSTDPSERKERKQERGEDRRPRLPVVTPGEDQGQGESNHVVRSPRPLPADKANGDDSKPERRNRREGEDSSARRPVDKPEDNGGQDNSSKERERRQPIYLPAPKQSDAPNDQPGNNEERTRERKQKDEERPRPRQDAPAQDDNHRRSDEQPEPRNHEDSTPRAERPQPPRSENKEQPREERNQQKQERQQERREERREERRKP